MTRYVFRWCNELEKPICLRTIFLLTDLDCEDVKRHGVVKVDEKCLPFCNSVTLYASFFIGL